MSDLSEEEDKIYPNPKNDNPLSNEVLETESKQNIPKVSVTITGWMGTNIIWVNPIINLAPDGLRFWCMLGAQ